MHQLLTLLGFLLFGLTIHLVQRKLNKTQSSVFKKYTIVGDRQKIYIYIAFCLNLGLILFGLIFLNNPYVLILLPLTAALLILVFRHLYQAAMVIVYVNILVCFLMMFIFFSAINMSFFLANLLILMIPMVLIDSVKFDESIFNKPWEEAEKDILVRLAKTRFYISPSESMKKGVIEKLHAEWKKRNDS